MTTTYSEIPPFKERISGSSLIIVGRVEKKTERSEDQSSDGSKFLIFYITIDELLKGKTTLSLIKVRVLDNKANKVDTSKRFQMNIGDKVLLFLSPDYGPNIVEDLFVLYFNSGYPVVDENNVKLDKDSFENFAEKKMYFEDTIVKLKDIRSMINKVEQDQERTEAAIAEHEPTELRNIPYPEITELPSPRVGGARHSSPEDGAIAD